MARETESRKARRGGRNAKGFTLVELLVVIGIIGLLVAILLPALQSARRQAMQVKCMSNLRQCETALMLYANTYKGYGVPLRCGGGTTANSGTEPQQLTAANNFPYTLWDFTYDAGTDSVPLKKSSAAAWWMNFLAHFISTQRGGVGDVDMMNSGLVKQTVFWCPSWQGAMSNDVVSGTQVRDTWAHATGYSMNYMPSLSATHPAAFQDATAANKVPSSEWFNISFSPPTAPFSYNPQYGTWYKLSQIKNSQQRCFLADSSYLMLVAWQALDQPGRGGGVTFPPQNILPRTNGNGPYTGGGTGIHGQNAFDYYRHGIYPPVIAASGGPAFDPNKGKISYNILYYDGHVANTNDRADAYRSVRMRFPQ